MPDSDIFKLIQDLFTTILGFPPPIWLVQAIAGFLLLLFSILAIVALATAIRKLWLEVIQPLFYNPEDLRRRSRRQLFADYIEGELRRLNTSEIWNDNRFTELEAKVEVDERRGTFQMLSFKFYRRSRFIIEKSLSAAIEKSSERLVLLEGDPGSGKSVALRHVCQIMARKAFTSRSLRAHIPLYINLKYLRRQPGQVVDGEFIENFILRIIGRANDKDIDDFLKEEYKKGIQDGTWFFLFDSFDEIPEILSSTGTDEIIRTYADAIQDFLTVMNRCRGIVASREYKAPRFQNWAKFRILPLSFDRQIELVKKTGLKILIQKIIIEGLALASPDFRSMTSNPMFLNLICEYMNRPEIPEFPSHIYNVFDQYIQRRLERDEERIQQRYHKNPKEVRNVAEIMAFCITAEQGIGLAPTIEQLEGSIRRFGFMLSDDFSIYVDALSYLKIAKIDLSPADEVQYFTFAHRRFQEFFATAVVLREPDRIPVEELITNGRWRETTVVILQTQQNERVAHILDAILIVLINVVHTFGKRCEKFNVANFMEPRQGYEIFGLVKCLGESMDESKKRIKNYFRNLIIQVSNKKEIKFQSPPVWPENLYHILSLLQDGVQNRRFLVSNDLQVIIDKILCYLFYEGDILNMKWCLEVAGNTSTDVLATLVRKGFFSPNPKTKAVCFTQASRLPNLPPMIKHAILLFLNNLSLEGTLFTGRHEIRARLSQLDQGNKYIDTHRLLVWLPIIDHLLIASGTLLIYPCFPITPYLGIASSMVLFVWAKWHAYKTTNRLVNIEIDGFGPILWLVYIYFFWFLFRTSECGSERIFLFFIFFIWGRIAAQFTKSLRYNKPIFWPLYFLPPILIIFSFLLIVNFHLLSYLNIKWFIVIILSSFTVLIIMMNLDLLYLLSRSSIFIKEAKNTLLTLSKRKIKMTDLFTSTSMLYMPSAVLITDISIVFFIIFMLLPDDITSLISMVYKYTFISFIIVFICLFVSYSIYSVIDMIRYFILTKHLSQNLTTHELVARMHYLRTAIARTSLLIFVKEHKLLYPSKENINTIRNMINFFDIFIYDKEMKHFDSFQNVEPDLAEIMIPKVNKSLPKFVTSLLISWDLREWNNKHLVQLCDLYEQLATSSNFPYS